MEVIDRGDTLGYYARARQYGATHAACMEIIASQVSLKDYASAREFGCTHTARLLSVPCADRFPRRQPLLNNTQRTTQPATVGSVLPRRAYVVRWQVRCGWSCSTVQRRCAWDLVLPTVLLAGSGQSRAVVWCNALVSPGEHQWSGDRNQRPGVNPEC